MVERSKRESIIVVQSGIFSFGRKKIWKIETSSPNLLIIDAGTINQITKLGTPTVWAQGAKQKKKKKKNKHKKKKIHWHTPERAQFSSQRVAQGHDPLIWGTAGSQELNQSRKLQKAYPSEHYFYCSSWPQLSSESWSRPFYAIPAWHQAKWSCSISVGKKTT